MSRVSVEIKDHIAHVTLTRGDKMNAVDMEMAEAIVSAGEQLKEDANIRAVILSGEGRAFCAGLDVANFAAFAAQDPYDLVMPRTHGEANLFQEFSLVWCKIPVPVIAALHGNVFGAGFQLALGADMRFCHPDTQLAVMEMKWGLVPDMGGMILLPHLVRSDVMRRLIYTNEVISAEQALDIGVITELADNPFEAGLCMAQKIAGKSPSAIRAAKRLIGFAESGAEAADVLLEESREQTALIGNADQREQIAANLQKRAPNFE